MINTVDEFMDEFVKHKDKVEWYLHQPTPFANFTDIRGRGVLCSPVTVMCDPPVHYHLDFIELDVDIHHSFELVVKNASEFSLASLLEAVEKYPPEKFPRSRAREAYELRKRLLDVLGLTEPES
ncbi:MAG: hypothetical protein AB1598_14250 [Thermodesulfobacteriota bacterium]